MCSAIVADHGEGGTGDPLVAMLRPGKANANHAADQIAVLTAALAQLLAEHRSRVLVRGDTGSGPTLVIGGHTRLAALT